MRSRQVTRPPPPRRPCGGSFGRISLLAAEDEAGRVAFEPGGDDIQVGGELAQLTNGERQFGEPGLRELTDWRLVVGDQLAELTCRAVDIGERLARVGQRLAQLARILAGQRLARRLVLWPDLHGDQVER